MLQVIKQRVALQAMRKLPSLKERSDPEITDPEVAVKFIRNCLQPTPSDRMDTSELCKVSDGLV